MSTLDSTESIRSHVPSDPTAREAINRYLDPGENLLWAGRPNLLGLSLYAIMLGIIWTIALLIGTHQQVVFFGVVVLPLCAIATLVQAGVFYGVTERRVLWVSTRSLRKKYLLDFPLCDAIGAPLKIFHRPLGMLDFGQTEAMGRRAGFAFFLGARAPYVYQIAVTAQLKLVDEAEQSLIAGFTSRPDKRTTRTKTT